MRILTLVCFFHFSGINNGFTYFVTSPTGVEPVAFAPALVQNSILAFNPAQWKRVIFDPIRTLIFPKSERVVRLASQRILQSIFAESNLFQLWFKDSCLKTLPSSKTDSLQSNIKSSLEKVLALAVNKNPIRALREAVISANSGPVFTVKFLDYLKSQKRGSWFLDRLQIWQAHKYKPGLLPQAWIPDPPGGKQSFINFVEKRSRVQETPGIFLLFQRLRSAARHMDGEKSDGDARFSELSRLIVNQPLPRLIFFLSGGSHD